MGNVAKSARGKHELKAEGQRETKEPPALTTSFLEAQQRALLAFVLVRLSLKRVHYGKQVIQEKPNIAQVRFPN